MAMKWTSCNGPTDLGLAGPCGRAVRENDLPVDARVGARHGGERIENALGLAEADRQKNNLAVSRRDHRRSPQPGRQVIGRRTVATILVQPAEIAVRVF